MMSKALDKMIEVRKHESKEILIKEFEGVGMITLRGNFSNKSFQKALTESCKLGVPKPLSIKSNKDLSLAWMSPDELLLIIHTDGKTEKIKKELGFSLEGMHSLVLDVSGSRKIFMIEGTLWRELLAKGSPVDLRKKSFTKGSFLRTRIGQVSVAFWMVSNNSVYVICGRSYSSFFYEWLCNAAVDGSLRKFF